MQMAAAAALEQDVDEWEVSAATAEAAAAAAAGVLLQAGAQQQPAKLQHVGLLHFRVQAVMRHCSSCLKRPRMRSG
jgi:hypothetical protein